MSASPRERGIKRLGRWSAHDDNKATVQGDMPGNNAATRSNTYGVSRSVPALATPVFIVVPNPSGWVELAFSLVVLAFWAALTWRGHHGGPPVS